MDASILASPFFEVAGDYSTSYIAHPLVPRRLYHQLPQTKIIAFLRNPVDRAYSHFIMSGRAGLYVKIPSLVRMDFDGVGRETEPFETIIERELRELEPLLRQFRHCFNHPSCDVKECLPSQFAFRRHDAPGTPFLMMDELDLKDYLFTSYLFRSVYADQVERWLSTFPREQSEYGRGRVESNESHSTGCISQFCLSLQKIFMIIPSR